MKTRLSKSAASAAFSSTENIDSSSSDAPSNKRQKTGRVTKSVTDFKFDKARVRLLSDVNEVAEGSNGIVYWMSRDQRVQDNWALLYSQRLALKCSAPLHVCFCLSTNKSVVSSTARHHEFLLRGLEEVEQECRNLNISFHLLHGEPPKVLFKFVKQNAIGGVVTDFTPLRIPLKWLDEMKKNLPDGVSFCQVDAHNVVPCWEASNKLEYAARTIRKKIQSKLSQFLTEFPSVVRHVFPPISKPEATDWDGERKSAKVDRSVGPVDWAVPGTKAGLAMLDEFCAERLKGFALLRNDPTKNQLSNLSPWLHFGQISAQRCALMVRTFKKNYSDSVDAFLEEAIIRRELADNFCFYNPDYDSLDGTNEWARKTLDDHRADKREYLYTKKQFEEGRTHDDLWNAAQRQMVREGKMHGFLRMYWAKKILEWTASPEEALEIAIYLNDKYELDGSDPNGFVGCMWSIVGIHDQGWGERPVFGKIRFMNYKGCQRKFDVPSFVARYGA